MTQQIEKGDLEGYFHPSLHWQNGFPISDLLFFALLSLFSQLGLFLRQSLPGASMGFTNISISTSVDDIWGTSSAMIANLPRRWASSRSAVAWRIEDTNNKRCIESRKKCQLIAVPHLDLHQNSKLSTIESLRCLSFWKKKHISIEQKENTQHWHHWHHWHHSVSNVSFTLQSLRPNDLPQRPHNPTEGPGLDEPGPSHTWTKGASGNFIHLFHVDREIPWMWREKEDSKVKKLIEKLFWVNFSIKKHGGSKRMFNHMLYIKLTMVYKVKTAMLFILLLKTVHLEIKRFQKIHRHFCKTILCVQVPLLSQAHSTRGKTAGTSVFAASLDISSQPAITHRRWLQQTLSLQPSAISVKWLPWKITLKRVILTTSILRWRRGHTVYIYVFQDC